MRSGLIGCIGQGNTSAAKASKHRLHWPANLGCIGRTRRRLLWPPKHRLLWPAAGTSKHGLLCRVFPKFWSRAQPEGGDQEGNKFIAESFGNMFTNRAIIHCIIIYTSRQRFMNSLFLENLQYSKAACIFISQIDSVIIEFVLFDNEM